MVDTNEFNNGLVVTDVQCTADSTEGELHKANDWRIIQAEAHCGTTYWHFQGNSQHRYSIITQFAIGFNQKSISNGYRQEYVFNFFFF